jgi:allantoicase
MFLLLQHASAIATGVKGVISALEVDTNFYKGNYPESCLVRTLA